MSKKIFRSILAVSAAVLLICVLCVSYVLHGYFGKIIEDELKEEGNFVAQIAENDVSGLYDIKNVKNRITLIAQDGSVLFDSYKDAADMDNHGSREEIAEAEKNGEAFAVRYSDTLSTRTIYYAKLLDNGDVVRIAQQQSMVSMMLRGMLAPFILILIAVIILAYIVSRKVASWITAPVNALDPEDPEAEEPYPELAPLLTKIREQNRRIDMQLEAMKRRQKEFMAITENMSEGFLLIDTKMEILSYNTAAVRLLGDTDTEEPHSAFELNRSTGFRTAAEEALSGRHSQQPLELKNRYYNIIANPVTESGKVVGAVIIIMDVTEKEQREKLRREFTSNVSHELKTPLTTIYGVSDMMAEGIVKQHDVKDFGRTIRDESGRMITLIDDIIKLSKLDENSFPEEFSEVDLMESAKDVIERLSMKAEEKGVSMYLEGSHAKIHGIPSLCNEIIYNLCDNAIKYNRENGSVIVKVADLHEGAELSVEDTGIGIPFECRDRIFERFFRVDESHNQQVDGTGLGLSIVKHAVAQMGGTIEVESADGIGTKMIVRFGRSSGVPEKPSP